MPNNPPGLPANPSESFKRRNPQLYSVRAVEAGRAEQTSVCSLGHCSPKQESGGGGVEFRVVIVALRRRLLDPDAVAFACKPITDSIARWLGLDDADPRLKFEWHQLRSDAEEGLIVRIEETILAGRKRRTRNAVS